MHASRQVSRPVRIVQRGDLREPGAYGGGILEAKLPMHPVSDRDGNTSLILDALEAILIGEIISDEHGFSSGKRRLVQKCLDGGGFREAARLDLQHHVASLDVIIAPQLRRERAD